MAEAMAYQGGYPGLFPSDAWLRQWNEIGDAATEAWKERGLKAEAEVAALAARLKESEGKLAVVHSMATDLSESLKAMRSSSAAHAARPAKHGGTL